MEVFELKFLSEIKHLLDGLNIRLEAEKKKLVHLNTEPYNFLKWSLEEKKGLKMNSTPVTCRRILSVLKVMQIEY